MKRLPPLKSLLAFRYAGEQLSFKAAAEQLHVTPTAISQQIKLLEEDLGTPLFKRKTRKVELTFDGNRLLPHVINAFSLLEQGVQQVLSDPDPHRLVMTALPSFSSRFLIPRLNNFYDQNPETKIHLQPSLSLASFSDDSLDLAIRFGRGDYAGLRSKLLLEDYSIPVCHPSLIDANKDLRAQLEALPIVLDDSNDVIEFWDIFTRETGIHCNYHASALRVSDANMLIEALVGAQGFSLLRYSLAYELLDRGVLVSPLNVYLKSTYQYYLVAPTPHFDRPKVQQFERWLRAQVKEIEESWQHYHTHTMHNARALNA